MIEAYKILNLDLITLNKDEEVVTNETECKEITTTTTTDVSRIRILLEIQILLEKNLFYAKN